MSADVTRPAGNQPHESKGSKTANTAASPIASAPVSNHDEGVDGGPGGLDDRNPHAPAAGQAPSLNSAVSVIVPVLNEADHLQAAVRAILTQEWAPGIEVVLAIGPSQDATLQVAEALAASDSRVLVVANPSGRTPDALNAALTASHPEVVIRVDAHSELPANYIATAVQVLVQTGADNVGGIMWPVGRTSFEKAVAAAMTSPVGVGSAAYHTGGTAGPSESVYLGAFRRSALERVGGYDPRFTRAQDWEMNHRIRETGGLVWFTPELVVTYRPRPTLRALARQYFQYGQWRRLVMKVHGQTLRRVSALRYLAPPALVAALIAALTSSIAGWSLPTSAASGLLADAVVVPIAYVAVVVLASIRIGRKLSAAALLALPLVIMTMHISWGLGFLRGDTLRD